MSEPRAYTAAECREMFLDQIRGVARYWASLPDKSPQERCDGVAFSILVAMDGMALDMPALRLLTEPHPDDEAFNRDAGQNWWPTGEDITNIDGELLHDVYVAGKCLT